MRTLLDFAGFTQCQPWDTLLKVKTSFSKCIFLFDSVIIAAERKKSAEFMSMVHNNKSNLLQISLLLW